MLLSLWIEIQNTENCHAVGFVKSFIMSRKSILKQEFIINIFFSLLYTYISPVRARGTMDHHDSEHWSALSALTFYFIFLGIAFLTMTQKRLFPAEGAVPCRDGR